MTAMPSRYHPLWVLAHWLTALLLAVSLVGGLAVLRHVPNSDPGKAHLIAGHAAAGLVIGGLLASRLLLRVVTRRPAPADAGHAALNRGRQILHALLYVAAFSMVFTGLGMLRSAGAFGAVFGRGGALPADFWDYPPRHGHFVYARVLLILIAMHIALVAYHEIRRRDSLLRRMWFGRRVPPQQ